MWRPSIPQLMLFAVGLISAIALAAFGGWPISTLWQPKLVAEIEVQDFALPSKFSMNPNEISDELSAELQRRANSDTALRFLLGGDGQQQVAEVVVPRLLNSGVISRMFGNMESLGTVMEVTEFHGMVTGNIRNDGDKVLRDVALTLPGALKAETADGTAVDVVEPRDDLAAVNFGDLEAGAVRSFTVWLDRPARDLTAAPQFVRTGAQEGVDGLVEMRGDRGWFGSGLEVAPWARWLVAGLLTLMAVLSFTGFAMSLFASRPSDDGTTETSPVATSEG